MLLKVIRTIGKALGWIFFSNPLVRFIWRRMGKYIYNMYAYSMISLIAILAVTSIPNDLKQDPAANMLVEFGNVIILGVSIFFVFVWWGFSVIVHNSDLFDELSQYWQ